MKKALVAGMGLLALGLGAREASAQSASATANPPAYTPGSQQLSQTLQGGLRTIIQDASGNLLGTVAHPLVTSAGGGGGSAPYVGTALGYQQLTPASATSLTVPNGATFAVISVEGAGVRYRDDGVAPTASVGEPVSAQTTFQYSGPLAAIQFIQQAATATVDVLYYK